MVLGVVSGASGTVAKSISAYGNQVSDDLYGSRLPPHLPRGPVIENELVL